MGSHDFISAVQYDSFHKHYFVLWLEHFLVGCCYLQVVSWISFTVDEMVHLVNNCVQKTKTIQLFFEKICSLSRLSLQSPSANYDSNHHTIWEIIEATHQNFCVVVSLELNRRWSVLFHSLIDCGTHFNNLRLLLVYQSLMLDSSTFFDTSVAIEIVIDTLIFTLSQPTLLIFQRFCGAPFL